MPYESYILPHAQREIRKFPGDSQKSILRTCLKDLPVNPRPEGYRPVVGYKGLYRVRSEDGRYRILYNVDDALHVVIILTVRLKGEKTYRMVPVHSLFAKIKELRKMLKK